MSLRLTPSEITLTPTAENSILNQLEKATSVFTVFFIFPLKIHSSHCITDAWTYNYLQCMLVFPHFRLILSAKLTVPGKLISSDAGRVHLHTSHTMLQRQKDKHLLKKLSPSCQNLLFLKKEPSLMAFVAQHTLFPQTIFHCVSNKNSPTWKEKTANILEK